MALAQTNGSVRIFSLDEPAQQPVATASAQPITMAPLHPLDNSGMTGSIEKTSLDPSGGTSAAMPVPVPQSPQSAPSATDSSVMVFSLDEAAPRPRAQPRQPVSPYPSGWMPGNDLPSSPHESFGWASSREPVAKIYFRNGSADLTPLMQNLVEQLAADAKSGRMITIEGHASRRASTKDPVEARIVNLKMSMQRALAVSQELIRKGVPAPSIKTTARGDNQPPQTLEQGMSIESASRRVEIFQD
jgi:outer membrane protein OmpA-like peptidoglycan-associated protein